MDAKETRVNPPTFRVVRVFSGEQTPLQMPQGGRPQLIEYTGKARSEKGVGTLHGYMNQEDTRSNAQHQTFNIQRSHMSS